MPPAKETSDPLDRDIPELDSFVPADPNRPYDITKLIRWAADDDEFFEVFVDVPLAVAEARDPKGLYKKARAGQLQHFTGIDSPYEAPLHPDIHLDATDTDPADSAERVIERLRAGGYLGRL